MTINNEDKRSRHLTLTVAGRALVKAHPVRRETHAAMSGLGKSRPNELRSDLRAVLTFQKTHQPAAQPARIDDANRTGLAAALVRPLHANL